MELHHKRAIRCYGMRKNVAGHLVFVSIVGVCFLSRRGPVLCGYCDGAVSQIGGFGMMLSEAKGSKESLFRWLAIVSFAFCFIGAGLAPSSTLAQKAQNPFNKRFAVSEFPEKLDWTNTDGPVKLK